MWAFRNCEAIFVKCIKKLEILGAFIIRILSQSDMSLSISLGLEVVSWVDELNQFKFNSRKAIGTIEKIKKYVEHIKAKTSMDIGLSPVLE